MKKIKGICLLLCLLVLFMACPTMVSAAPDISVSDGCHSLDALKPLDGNEKLLDSAKAVMLYERKSDTMMYSYNPDVRLYPGSLAKILTALIAIEEGNLDQVVTFSTRWNTSR